MIEYLPWILLGVYFAVGATVYWIIFSGAKWTLGSKNLAPLFIITLWPLFLGIVILAISVAWFKLLLERFTK